MGWLLFFKKIYIYVYRGGLLKGNTDLQAAQQLNVGMW